MVRLPEHVRDLREVARLAAAGTPGGVAAYEDAVTKWERRIRRLGQGGRAGNYTVRSATQRLVEDLRGATTTQVEDAVERWVLERARHQARTVARHETVEAYRTAYEERASESGAVVGYRWTLSARHPRPDVCDLLANQDLHGLGPGGYPPTEVPSTPHTNCLCARIAIVDRAHMRRRLARETGAAEPPRPWESGRRETAEEWLLRQPPGFQDRLLGPTRAKILRDPADARAVVTPRGTPIPVYQVLSLPRPVRRLGPPVPTRTIIEADRRRGQASPFEALDPNTGASGSGSPPSSPPPPPTQSPAPSPPPPTRAQRLAALGHTPAAIADDAAEAGFAQLDRDAVMRLARDMQPAWVRLADGKTIGMPEQRSLRMGIRRLLRTADGDFGSRDVLERLPFRDQVGTLRAALARKANGTHSIRGMASFAKQTLRAAGQGLRRLARGNAPTNRQWQFLGTFIHEELHGSTPFGPSCFGSAAVPFEEAMVELRTRQVLRSVARALGEESPYGIPRTFRNSSGLGVMNLGMSRSYERYVRGLVRAVGEATGLAGNDLDDYLEEHIRRWFRIAPKGKTWTASTYRRALAELLHPSDPDKLDQLLAQHVR